jgi:hypothetical protein
MLRRSKTRIQARAASVFVFQPSRLVWDRNLRQFTNISVGIDPVFSKFELTLANLT